MRSKAEPWNEIVVVVGGGAHELGYAPKKLANGDVERLRLFERSEVAGGRDRFERSVVGGSGVGLHFCRWSDRVKFAADKKQRYRNLAKPCRRVDSL